MAARKYIAFDFGAESGRSIVGTLDGDRVSLQEAHRFPNPNGRMNGSLQWNLLGQWEQIKTGLKKAVELAAGPVDAIGVDTWGVDFGLLGRDGQILGNPVCYRDARTDGMLDLAFNIAGKREIFDATGIQFMQLNTLYQLLALTRKNSSQLQAAQSLLFMPDLFNYLLTGVARAEFSIATTSQMYDPRKKQWATGLLKKLGIPTHLLPPIVPSGTVLGTLRDEVMKELGVPAIDVVAPCGHDTGSAVVAVPAQGERWAYLSSGTWSLMGVELPEPVITDKSYDYNYTNEGGVGGSIRFLKNIAGLWLVQECRREFERQGRTYDYATLTKLASEAPAFGTLIDVNWPDFAAPGQMPQKIAAFCAKTGQPAPASDGAMVRACLDSLALQYRVTIDGLEDILGHALDVLHIVGGGTQNELLNQLTADACNKRVLAGPVEATALGNILVQGIAKGAVKDLAHARAIVRNSFEVKEYTPKQDVTAALARYRSLSMTK
ncbi:MAG: rhamnulokinase family protein [Tepidisphaeraceae bacterium]